MSHPENAKWMVIELMYKKKELEDEIHRLRFAGGRHTPSPPPCFKCSAHLRKRKEAEEMETYVREREVKALAENQALRDKIDILTKELHESQDPMTFAENQPLRDKIDALTKENYNLRQDKETAAGVVDMQRAYLNHAKEKNAKLEKENAELGGDLDFLRARVLFRPISD
jgi:chromosome segregation ATPase